MSGRPEPDFQRYLDALRELGLEPGASIADIRKAHKAMLRTCHPDWFPDDAEKAAQSGRVNAARDTLEAMSKAGDLQRFAQMAERTRRTGGQKTGAPLPASMVVLIVVAPAGMGKTQNWTRSTARRGARRPAILARGGAVLHIILAGPTIDLIEQIAADLAANGLKAPVVTILHSRNTKGGITPAMKKYYKEVLPEQDAILLVSHAAIVANPLPPAPESWDIYFDEMPETVTFIQLDGQVTHRVLTRIIEASPLGNTGLVSLAPHGDLRSMAWLSRIAINRPYDGGLEHYRELALALMHGHALFCPAHQWEELTLSHWTPGVRSQFGGHVDILVMVPPHWFRQFRSVVMMGASCLSHMTALLWHRIWQVEFHDDPRHGLPREHTAQQCRRLTLYWLYEERATRAFLARKAVSGESMFLATCGAVASFYDGQPFLWSAPQPGEDREHGVANDFWKARSGKAFAPLLRLPGRTHGLNRPEFLQTHAAALLSVVNLTPSQFELLNQFSLTDAEIDRALAFDVTYQDMCRCAIRLTSERTPCPVTVLDQPTALAIGERFPGCRVLQYPSDLIPQPLQRRGKRGPPPSGHRLSGAEKSRRYRLRKAEEKRRKGEEKRET